MKEAVELNLHDRSWDAMEGVVHEITLSCSCSYIGQTGRCVNKRIREHETNVEQNKEGLN